MLAARDERNVVLEAQQVERDDAAAEGVSEHGLKTSERVCMQAVEACLHRLLQARSGAAVPDESEAGKKV